MQQIKNINFIAVLGLLLSISLSVNILYFYKNSNLKTFFVSNKEKVKIQKDFKALNVSFGYALKPCGDGMKTIENEVKNRHFNKSKIDAAISACSFSSAEISSISIPNSQPEYIKTELVKIKSNLKEYVDYSKECLIHLKSTNGNYQDKNYKEFLKDYRLAESSIFIALGKSNEYMKKLNLVK
jgi:hypothetical protein